MNELNELLESLKPFNTGTSEAHEEFQANRVLSPEELLCLIYHDLKSWTKVEPNSASEKLRDALYVQLKQVLPGIEKTEKPKDVDIGWIIQEHICAETEDYSFGVYEEPALLRVLVQPGQPILPCLEDEAVDCQTEPELLLSKCPAFDLTDSNNNVEQCLLTFFDYYASAPKGTFHLGSKLIDDVEHYITGDLGGGRLFTTPDGEGGISDSGVVIATLIMFDLAKLTGVSVVDSDDACSFECIETEVGSYYECTTIGDIACILNDVKYRVMKNDENDRRC